MGGPCEGCDEGLYHGAVALTEGGRDKRGGGPRLLLLPGEVVLPGRAGEAILDTLRRSGYAHQRELNDRFLSLFT